MVLAAAAGGGAGLLAFGLLSAMGAAPVVALAVLIVVTLGVGRFMDSWLAQRHRRREEAEFPDETPVPDIDRIPLSALADAAVATDGWRIVTANDAALALFGQRIVGTDLRQTVRHPDVVEAMRQAMQNRVVMLREITAYGQKEDLRLRVAPAGANRFLLTFADISHTRLVERMRSDFVANASHELRTPLANLIGYIETLQGPAANDPAAQTRFLAIMAREAARMTRLIDDLLSLSRIEMNRYVRPESSISLAELVEETRRGFAPQVESANRALLTDVPADLPPVVGDHDQILQVLHNLVSNAIKYGRPGTPIRVAARLEPQSRRGQMVRLSIQDEGEGIPSEHLPRLTERFYRVDAGRSNALGGTGLGLSIVKHIVERHRGQLEIESVQGKGTTISFILPASEVDEPGVTKS